MPRNLADSPLMKPFVVLALPGMYLFYKYNQYKQQQQEQCRRKVTERELAHLNHKIDKLLTKLEENEPEVANSQEDECVICVNAKATMQTSPCGHRVVCRKCFVKTIQMAVSQRVLPLRCVICRAKILRLKQSTGRSWLPTSASQYSVRSGWGRSPWSSSTSGSLSARSVPPSASQYSMSARSVSTSASMYSMTSGSSSLSGVSSVSSATNTSTNSKSSSSSSQTSGSGRQSVRQPTGSLRKSQQYSMKVRIQEYNEPRTGEDVERPRLPPIAEFQREYRLGRERAGSSSTRIRCAQNILTQLEKGPSSVDRETPRKPQVNHARPGSAPPNKPAEEKGKSCAATTPRSAAPRSVRESSTESQNRNKPSDKEKETKKDETPAKSEKEERKEAKAAKKEAKKLAKREAKREAKEKKEAKEKEKREAKEREAREKKERKEAKKESTKDTKERLLDNMT